MGMVYGGETVTEFADGLICERWPLIMPDFRVTFHAERPKWEIGRLEHMADRVDKDMVAWDVGAEHGDFTALYRTWGAVVVPVEPAPAYWPCIRQTYEANGFGPPPACFRGFAADVSRGGRVRLGGWPPESVGPVVADPGFRHLAYHAKQIPCITLDDLAHVAPTPDVLSIDVEGAEWHVLSGAQDLLEMQPVLVYVSVHPPTMRNWYARTPADLISLMHEVGYEGSQLPHHGEAEEFWVWERRL